MTIRLGMAVGCLVWGAYTVAEIGFLVVRRLAVSYDQMMLPVHWRFLPISIGAYLLAGVASGAWAAWVGRRLGISDGSGARRLVVSALAAAYLLNLSLSVNVSPWDSRRTVALALGGLVFAGALSGLIWRRLERISRLWADPWTMAVLLVAGPLTAPRFRPLAVLSLLAAAAALFVLSRLALERGRTILGVPSMQLAALTLGLAAAVGAIPLAEQQPRWRPALPNPAPAGNPPNVILIVMDTVRADHLSVYGYGRQTTPRLERFAEGATLHPHAFAVSNFTLPSHASMFTGLYARTHGATYLPPELSFGEPLDAKFETLAERLALHGYLNLAVVANHGYLNPEFGFDQGFHFYDARRTSVCLPDQHRWSLRFGLRRFLQLVRRTEPLDQKFRTAAEVNQAVFALLDKVGQQNIPFFLFVNYMDCHDPYIPPAPLDRLFEGRDSDLMPEDWTILAEGAITGSRKATDKERRHFVSQYDGAIAYLDSQIGALLDELARRGLFDNTMLIVTSDHGEAFGEHGYWGHGWSLHQHEIGVPLIIKYPGQHAAQVCESNTSHVDLMPTVLEVVGIAAPRNLPGRSLLGCEARTDSRPIHAEAYLGKPKVRQGGHGRAAASWAAISARRLKLICASDGRMELYDLDDDPAETRNLNEVLAPESAELLRRLEAWREEFPLTAEALRPKNRLTLEHLKTLGYVR